MNDLKETIDLCVSNGIRSAVKTFGIDQGDDLVKSVEEDDRVGKSVLVF